MQSILFNHLKSISICLLFFLALSPNSYATNYVWNGSYGLWDAPHNWIPNGVPGPGDLATINSGAARVQFGISANVGRIIIADEGELRIYPHSTLNVLNYTNGSGIQNDGSLLIYGTLNIESILSANGYGIKNDGSVYLTATAECNIIGIKNVAIFNNLDFVNNGFLNISDISSHGILNYGLMENNGEVDIEISPEVFTWGILNFDKIYNTGTLSLSGLNGGLELGGILNTSSGNLLNFSQITIQDINGAGIKNIGNIVNEATNPAARMTIRECGTGIALMSGSNFKNDYNTYITINPSDHIGMLVYGSLSNYGTIGIHDSQHTDLYIEPSGSFTNHQQLNLGFGNNFTLYSILNRGSFFNATDVFTTGRVRDFGNIKTYNGSSFINDGSYHSFVNSNPTLGEDILNHKVIHDNFGLLSNNINNKGIVVRPYPNAVQIGIPAMNFLDIESTAGMAIQSNVYEVETWSSQIVGSYNSQNNSFTANANATGLSSVFVRIELNPGVNNSVSICEVMLPTPINLKSDQTEVSSRNKKESSFTFNVYPVPASSTLFLKHEFKEAFDYAIYNTLGERIEQGHMNETKMDIDHLTTGEYFLKVESEGKSYNKKFIKI